METSCSPRHPPNDLQNVRNSPDPPTTDMFSPKWGLNPQISFGTNTSNPPQHPEAIPRRACKKSWEVFVAKRLIERNEMNCLCIPWVNWWLRFGNYRTEQIPWQTPENFTILCQGAALERPTFPIRPLLFRVPEPSRAALLDCREIHRIVRVLGETFFWTTICSRRTILYDSAHFKEFGILFGIETWCYRNSKERDEMIIVEHVHSMTSLPKYKWNVESCWWNLFSLLCDGLSVNSYYGMESRKISWLYGISQLESQFQNWGLSKNSRSSDYYALDQRSWVSKINWRTCDVAIGCGERFTRFRYAWCDDCVCIEKVSQHTNTFPKKSMCRRSSELRISTDFYEEDKMRARNTSIPVQLEHMNQYKDSQLCSQKNYRMTTSKMSTSDGSMLCYLWVKCPLIWFWKRCTSQNYRTLLNFRL